MTTQMNSCLLEDIIVNILLRLPAKSIGQCRCVSKQWCYLLSQPHFIKAHTDHTRNSKTHQHSLLFLDSDFDLYYAALDDTHQVFDEMSLRPTKLDCVDGYDVRRGAFASCDGLVLIESETKFILLNPITHQVNHIPFHRVKLASTIFGLGYDSVNHDYKIVTLSQPSCLVNVYSVKNDAWKNAENRPYNCFFHHSCLGVFLNGYIHWCVSGKSEDKSKILSFELVEEKFYEVFLPNAVSEDIKYGNINDIVLLRGCLCVFSSSYRGDTCVWIMNEYGNNESWTKFTFIDPDGKPFMPICMLDQGQQLLVERDTGYLYRLVKYNLNNGTFKDIVVDGIGLDVVCVGGTFVEGLVSPSCSHETS